MFTIKQINQIHDTYGRAATLAQYLQALRAIGVETHDSCITDGHSEYFASPGQKVASPPVHAKLVISDESDKEGFFKHLALHKQGKTNYFQMSEGLAASGIEKWMFDTAKMTITYYDKAGQVMLVEHV
jgi:uncharacterized protein YbcV (DUF1398 family)